MTTRALLCLLTLLLGTASGLEAQTEIAFDGTVEILHTDTFSDEGSEDRLLLHDSDGVRYLLELTGDEGHPWLPAGNRIVGTGLLDEETWTLTASLDDIHVLEAEGGPPVSRRTTTLDVLVILMDFDDGSVSCTVPQVNDMILSPSQPATMDKLYRESSFGRLELQGNVVRVALDSGFSVTEPCDPNRFFWAFDAHATLAGGPFDISNYDKIIHVVPTTTSCPAGVAVSGGSWSWVSQCWDPQPYAHEFGHQLGMGHAGRRYWNGTYFTYGDYSDTMGTYRHRVNAPHLDEMSWADDAEIFEITSGSGTLVGITPLYEPPGSGFPRMIKIADPQTGKYFYVSVRTPDPPFDNGMDPAFPFALSIHQYKSPGIPTTANTVLLDILDAGQTFGAYYDTLEIRHAGTFAGLFYVEVDIHPCYYSTPPCVPPPDPGGGGGTQ